MYEMLGLYEDCLVQYDELDALFTQFVLNHAAGGASIHTTTVPLNSNEADVLEMSFFTLTINFETFLPARRYASTGNSYRNVSVRPSVRLSVCLSRVGIVSKRRNLAA